MLILAKSQNKIKIIKLEGNMIEDLICVTEETDNSTECGPGCCGPVSPCNPDD